VRDVEDRTWEVVRRAYEEHHAAGRPRHVRRAFGTFALRVGVFAVAAALVAALASTGQAVFKRFREAVGVEHAAPALFSLPAPGRLLVVSPEGGGVWLVRPDGFKRRLGSYDDAAWSPHGRFVVATQRNQLIALDPDGNVRWTLTRRNPAWPAWEGTTVDTRIAYLSATGLRVVAGDGTGDHLLDRYAEDVPPAWDPARLHTVAYYSGGAILLRASAGRILWRAPISVIPSALSWSSDGRLVAVVSSKRVVVLDAQRGRSIDNVSMLGATFVSAAFAPHTHRLAVELRRGGRSDVRLVDVDQPGGARLLFAGPGVLGDLAWSPNGEWLLVSWPAANQWIFLHGTRVRAVSNIRQQFPRADHLPPTLEVAGRWCCAS
jgi:hypothetical protein